MSRQDILRELRTLRPQQRNAAVVVALLRSIVASGAYDEATFWREMDQVDAIWNEHGQPIAPVPPLWYPPQKRP